MNRLFDSTVFKVGLTVVVLLAMGCLSPDEKKMSFMKKGSTLFEKKEYVKAGLEFKNAAQIDPEYAPAYYMQGRVQIATNRYKKAYAFFTKAVELDPEYMDARLELGRLLLAGKAIDRAKEQLAYILERMPHDPSARLLQASILFTQKLYDQSKAVLLDLIKADHPLPDVYLLLSSIALKQADPKQAFGYIETGLSLYPKHLLLNLKMAQMSVEMQDFNQAEICMKQIVEQRPDHIQSRLNLMGLFLDQDRQEDALALAEDLLKRQPENPEVRMRLADFWISRHREAKGMDLIRKGIESDPQNVSYPLFLSGVHINAGRLDKARSVLEEALSLNKEPSHPDMVKIKVALAKLSLRQQDKDEAWELVLQVLNHDAKNLDARMLKGRILMSENKASEAVAEFRLLAEQRPEVEQGHLLLAQAHTLNQEEHLAIDVLMQAKNRIPDSMRIMNTLARYLVKAGRSKEAGKLLQQSVADHPDDFEAVLALGDFYFGQKEYESALRQYARLKEVYSEKSAGYLRTARVYQAQEMVENAFLELKTAYAGLPGSGQVFTALVDFHLSQNRAKEAIELCRRRLEKNDKEGMTWLMLGSIYEAARDFDSAAAVYKDACRALPYMWAPANNYAYIRSETARSKTELEEAMDYAVKARTLNPGAFTVADTIGWIHFKTGAFNLAYSEVKKALNQDPDNPVINYHMGMILQKQGNPIASRTCLEKAVSAKKQFQGIEVARDTLRNLGNI